MAILLRILHNLFQPMRYLFLLILLISLPLFGRAQKSITDEFNYLATYRFTWQSDSTNANSAKTENMLLYLGKVSSRFSSAGTMQREQILKDRKKGNRSTAEFSRLQAQIPPTSVHYSIFKHYPSSEMSYTESIALEDFRYQQKLDLFPWKIEVEQKEIQGYQAQKATTSFGGRDYIAWFASEIPIPDGPYKFNGLPGLILKLHDTKGHYIFELVQFESLEEPIEMEFKSKNFIAANKDKFLQVKEEYNKDPMAAIERSGISFQMDPKARAKMHKAHLAELKKRNNPIELE